MLLLCTIGKDTDFVFRFYPAQHLRIFFARSIFERFLLVACLLFVSAARGQTNYQRTLSFGPSAIQGSGPRGQIIEASDGFLYGTTYQGGSENSGTVFKATKAGTNFQVLDHFTNVMFPAAGVIEGPSGALYGTTSGGGAGNSGTVFRVNRDGSGFTILHNFSSFASDGNTPLAGLMLASNGALYGTTAGGGLSNLGCIFKISPDGSGYQIIHSFTGDDGSSPVGNLTQAQNGALWGTAKTGGSNNLGVIFMLSSDGTGFAVAHHFAGKNFNDGSFPLSSLVENSGFLLGTTYNGGAGTDFGTVYKLSTNGTAYTVLHSFQGGTGDGSLPVSTLTTVGAAGVFVGTTSHGGATDSGVAFGLNSDGGGYSILHVFNSTNSDGSYPFAPLLSASDGGFYGSTYFGGAYATNGVSGILFRLFSTSALVRITAISQDMNGAALQCTGGASGQFYRILTAEDAGSVQWSLIGSNSASLDGTFSFVDTNATQHTRRFYRTAFP